MAEEDIYGSKKRYERVVSTIENRLENVNINAKRGKNKYFIKCKENLKYFYKLFILFDVKDLSYARRVKVLTSMFLISSVPDKDLKDCTRDDINEIIVFMHTRNKTIISKRDFIKDLKCLWRMLFPELDEKGRPDETSTPYVVRHISRKIDKSKQKSRLLLKNNKIKILCLFTT